MESLVLSFMVYICMQGMHTENVSREGKMRFSTSLGGHLTYLSLLTFQKLGQELS